MNLPARVKASRQKAVSFFHVLLCRCHKRWPRFRVSLPLLNNVIKKIPKRSTSSLSFSWLITNVGQIGSPGSITFVGLEFQSQQVHFRSYYLRITWDCVFWVTPAPFPVLSLSCFIFPLIHSHPFSSSSTPSIFTFFNFIFVAFLLSCYPSSVL